jgi:hypothetical protein
MNAARRAWRPDGIPHRSGGARLHPGDEARHLTVGMPASAAQSSITLLPQLTCQASRRSMRKKSGQRDKVPHRRGWEGSRSCTFEECFLSWIEAIRPDAADRERADRPTSAAHLDGLCASNALSWLRIWSSSEATWLTSPSLPVAASTARWSLRQVRGPRTPCLSRWRRASLCLFGMPGADQSARKVSHRSNNSRY